MDWESPYQHELTWCPDCATPAPSDQAHVLYCNLHAAFPVGTDDRILDTPCYLMGGGEVGGEPNKAMCDLLHRGVES